MDFTDGHILDYLNKQQKQPKMTLYFLYNILNVLVSLFLFISIFVK